MPPYILRPVVLSDAAAIARNNMSAFWEDPNWQPLWGNTTLDFVISQSAKRQPKTLLSERDTYRQECAVDAETGELVGFARWVLPESRKFVAGSGGGGGILGWGGKKGEPEWKELQIDEVGAEEWAEIQKNFSEARWERSDGQGILYPPIEKKTNEIMSTGTFLSLDLLAVDPRYKRQGIATQLINSGIAAAERMGMDVFIMGWKTGLPLYLKCGFELVDRIVQDDSMYGGDGEWVSNFLVKRHKQPMTAPAT